MPTRRAPSRGQSHAAHSSSPSSSPASPALSAALVLAAVGYATMQLVDRRELSWPPRELLPSLATLAGCLGMVGPLLLWRRPTGEATLGELTWMVGGLILWAFDLSALALGRTRGLDWAAPVRPELLGPVILAVMVGGWRAGRSPWSWTWTSLIGWLLGLTWVGLGILAMLPGRSPLPSLELPGLS